MIESRTEYLVVVADAERYDDVIVALGRHATITQQLPPRLVLAVPAADVPPETTDATWHGVDVPADILDALTPAEQLFVKAWRQRQLAKQRPGDGLPWDAVGFEPPDVPPGD